MENIQVTLFLHNTDFEDLKVLWGLILLDQQPRFSVWKLNFVVIIKHFVGLVARMHLFYCISLSVTMVSMVHKLSKTAV